MELPIANDFLARHPGRGLEIGNVLGHYIQCGHVVVDKYEVAPGVLNLDILEYVPEQHFDWIVALSTLEHVGWDENPLDVDKSKRAFEHLLGMLSPTGRLLLSLPLGYHRVFDQYILNGAAPAPDWRCILQRKAGNRWQEVSASGAAGACYDCVHRRAFRVLIAEFSNGC